MANNASCLFKDARLYELASAVGIDPTVALAKVGTWLELNKSIALKEYVNYSGAALGSDTVWEQVGKEYGLGKQVNYKVDSLAKLTPEQTKEVEEKYQEAARILNRKVLESDSYSGKLVRRDYLQAKAADSVFAIIEDLDNKGYPKGGTAYAVTMAIQMKKPIFAFNQSNNSWLKVNYGKSGNFQGWEVLTEAPTLTPKYAGIGTRQINEMGKQAIEDVYNASIYPTPEQFKEYLDSLKEKSINIYAGTGENAELSNLAERPFTVNNISIHSVEQAFQVAKLLGLKHWVLVMARKSAAVDKATIKIDEILKLLLELPINSGGIAKRLGNTRIITHSKNVQEAIDSYFSTTPYQGNWENTSSEIMQNFIKKSFEQNPDALLKLLATGLSQLTHTQDKGKWGVEFPKLLMKVREKLLFSTPEQFKEHLDGLKKKSINIETRGKNNPYSKLEPARNPDTAYIFTENMQAYAATHPHMRGGSDRLINTATPDNVKINVSDMRNSATPNTAGIRSVDGKTQQKNVFGLVVKKYQQLGGKDSKFVSKEGQFNDTDLDFNLFLAYNRDFFEAIIMSKLNKIIFPESIALGRSALPLRFAKWLQKELKSRFDINYNIKETTTSGYEGYGLEIINKTTEIDNLLSNNLQFSIPELNLDSLNQTPVIKAKGKMTFSYGQNKRTDILATTTLEAIKLGERTATTRYESDGHIDYWKNLKEGDIIEFEGVNNEKVLVEVTRPLHKLEGSGKTPQQWSLLEGWSVEYFNSKVAPKLKEAWLIEYKYLDSLKEIDSLIKLDLLETLGEEAYNVRKEESLKFIKDNFGTVVSVKEIINEHAELSKADKENFEAQTGKTGVSRFGNRTFHVVTDRGFSWDINSTMTMNSNFMELNLPKDEVLSLLQKSGKFSFLVGSIASVLDFTSTKNIITPKISTRQLSNSEILIKEYLDSLKEVRLSGTKLQLINMLPVNEYNINYFDENKIEVNSYYYEQVGNNKFVDYLIIEISNNIIRFKNGDTGIEDTLPEKDFYTKFNMHKDTGFRVEGNFGFADVWRYSETVDGRPIYSLEIVIFDKEKRGHGLGKDIYKAAIAEIKKNNGLLTPGNVVEGNKIWESFERDLLLKTITTKVGKSIIVLDSLDVSYENKVEEPINKSYIRPLTNSEILSQNFSAQERKYRVSAIARDFSNIVSQLKKSRPDSTREDIIKEFGVRNIFRQVEKRITGFSVSDKYTPEQLDKFKKMLKYFEALAEETSPLLTRYENLMINPESDVVTEGVEKDSNYEEDVNPLDTEESTTTDGDSDENVKDGWMIKARFISPSESLSEFTRKLLMDLKKIGYDGKTEVDDLGIPQLVDPNMSHRVLIEKLCTMESGEDLIPYLLTLSKTRPWVKQLIPILQKDKTLHSLVFQDFMKYFVSYWASTRSKNKDGSFSYKTINLNKPDGATYMVEDWKNIIESGTMLTKNGVYNLIGEIDHVLANTNKTRIEALRELVKNKSLVETDKIVKDNIKEINDLVKGVGIDISNKKLIEALNSQEPTEENNQGIVIIDNHYVKNLLSNLYIINDKLGTEGRFKNSKTVDLINVFENQYRPISEILVLSAETMIESSIHENGKSQYSFTAPSYNLSIRNKIKNKDINRVNKFFNKEFNKHNWWFKYNSWVQDLKTNSKDRELFDYKTDLNFNGIEYTKLQPLDHTLSMITNFYADKEGKYAWYPLFILAEAPSGDFIKFKRYSPATHLNKWEEVLTDKFVDLAIQEYQRIKLVKNRAELINKGLLEGVKFFDKVGKVESRGLDFQFSPYLNAHKVVFEEYEKYENEDGIKDPAVYEKYKKDIRDLVTAHINEEYEKELTKYAEIGLFEPTTDNKNLVHLELFKSEAEARIGLKNFFMNEQYAMSQVLQIFTTDLAYYPDLNTVLKRMKEIHTPGLHLDTTAEHMPKDGMETTIYLKDIEKPSNNIDNIKKAFAEFVKVGYVTLTEADVAIKKLSNSSVTDAQAFRSMNSFRAIMSGSGKWTKEKLNLMDKISKFRKGEDIKFTPEDHLQSFQTVKPFMYTQTSVTGLITKKGNINMRVPVLNKNTEALIAYGQLFQNSPLLLALEEFMEEHDIAVVQFNTAVKAGEQGTIDISDLTDKQLIKDHLISKIYTKDQAGKQQYNYQVVHQLSYNDYAIVQPIPDHFLETSQKIGSLILKLFISDMPLDSDLSEGKVFTVKINGKDYTRKEALKFYSDIVLENLLESYYNVAKDFSSIDAVAETLMSEVNKNARYGPEIKQAITLISEENGINFTLPLGDPIHNTRTQSMVHSMVRNNITTLKIKGGSLVQVSSFGYDLDLSVHYRTDKDTGKLAIDYMDCYMPWYSKEYFEPLMDEKTGLLDINKKFPDGSFVLPKDLRNLIAYRIPTENKYSMCPLKIKGFLPQWGGTSIVMPIEAAAIMGVD